MYKCYIVHINTTEFYIYVKDGTTLLYSGINSIKRPNHIYKKIWKVKK